MTLPPISIFRTADALIAQRGEDRFRLAGTGFDALFAQAVPARWLHDQLPHATPILRPMQVLAPIQSQEVWAAGVTYLRSRDARMDDRARIRAAEVFTIVFMTPSGRRFSSRRHRIA